MNSKDQIICDQQKALKATEKALTEARARISRAHHLLSSGKQEEAKSMLGTHMKNVGLA